MRTDTIPIPVTLQAKVSNRSGVVECTIRSLDTAEAPVVIHSPVANIDFRAHEGRLLAPLRDRTTFIDTTYLQTLGQTDPLPATDLAQAREQMQSRLDDAVLIDGILHEETLGPNLAALPSRGQSGIFATMSRHVFHRDIDSYHVVGIFSAFDHEQALLPYEQHFEVDRPHSCPEMLSMEGWSLQTVRDACARITISSIARAFDWRLFDLPLGQADICVLESLDNLKAALAQARPVEDLVAAARGLMELRPPAIRNCKREVIECALDAIEAINGPSLQDISGLRL